LGLTSRREAAHRPFALARRLMRVFGPVIEALVAAMFDTRHDFPVRGLVAAQLIRDQDAWHILAFPQELAEELLRGCRVPAALHQDIQDVPMLINGAPQIVRLAIDREKDFVEVPCIARSSASATQLVGIRLGTLQAPLPNRLVCDDNTAFGKQFLNIPVTE
jgi:hypothetical protein